MLPIITEAVENGLSHTSETGDDDLPHLIDKNERIVDLNANDVVETELPRLEGVYHPPAIATCQSRALNRDARESLNTRWEHADRRDDEILV